MTSYTVPMTSYAVPLVGMHFKPPAKLLLGALPMGAELRVIPEPTNAYDPNALAVWITPQAIPTNQHEDLGFQLFGMGFTLEEILETPTWQLGYIAKDAAAVLCEKISSRLTEEGYFAATLGFTPEGKPTVRFNIEENYNG